MEEIRNVNVTETAMRAGAAISKPVVIDENGIPYTVIPEGYSVNDLEFILQAPTRKRGDIVTNDTQSFVKYVKKHGSLDECVIYADIDTTNFSVWMVAVINDHHSDTPQWRDHRCTFSPKKSVEFMRWQSKTGVAMPQVDFATFLEDNLPDIASLPNMPSGQDMLQMALNFEATADKRMRSKTNLQSGGVSFEFVDQDNDQTRTRMEVFSRFTIGIPVFEGSTSAYPVEARLKYREKDGKLSFWYELIRLDRVFKTATNDELAEIVEKTGFMLLNGKP